MMELGATLCCPRNPACDRCPVNAECLSLANHTVEHRPVKKKAAPPREDEWVALVWRTPDGSVWLARRPDEGLWSGLWEYPMLRHEDAHMWVESNQAGVMWFDPVVHVLSHIRMTVTPLLVQGDAGEFPQTEHGYVDVKPFAPGQPLPPRSRLMERIDDALAGQAILRLPGDDDMPARTKTPRARKKRD
jgi:A/G-specific adenine glycosylase